MSEIVFKNTETGRAAAYIITPSHQPLIQWIEEMIDLMESTMNRKFTPVEREWLRQDNIHPLPFEVKYIYEFDISYEQSEWREMWFDHICESMSGYGYGWISTFLPLRWILTDCDNDNELEVIDELFNRDKISGPFSFYRAVYLEDICYGHYESPEMLAKEVAGWDCHVDLDTWVTGYIDWEEMAEDLINGDVISGHDWYYNEESWVGCNLEQIDTRDYPRQLILSRHGIINDGDELLTMEDFERLNNPSLKEPITIEDIINFLGGDVA